MRVLTFGYSTMHSICDVLLISYAILIAARSKRVRSRPPGATLALLCYAALGALASQACVHWSDIHYPLSVAALPLLSLYVEGRRPFQLANIFGIYRTISSSSNDSLTWYNLLCTVIHGYLLLSNLGKNSQQTLKDVKEMLLYTQTRRLIGIQKIRDIVLDDIEALPKRMQLRSVLEEFKYNVDEPLFLLRAIFRMTWRPLAPLVILTLFLDVLHTMTSVAGNRVLYFFDAPLEYGWHSPYLSIVSAFVLSILSTQLFRVKSFVRRESNRVIKALKLVLFRLPLMNNGLQNNYRIHKAHDAINYLACSFETIHSIFSVFTRLLSTLTLLYVSIGWLAFIPLAVNFTYIFIETAASKMLGPKHVWDIYRKPYEYDDKVDEVFYNIKSIKTFGWERMYSDPKLLKHWETAEAKKYDVWYAPFAKAVWVGIDIFNLPSRQLSAYLSLFAYVHLDPNSESALSAASMFQLSGLITSIQSDFSILLYQIRFLRSFVEVNYIIERALRGEYINTLRHNYLSNGDNCKDSSDQEKVYSGPIVRVNEGEFSWTKGKAVLKDISFEANPGQLVAVVGKTGSGKSSFLMSICGEVEMTKGTGSVVGSIALVEQVPWIMNGTLRENILFGREYDQEFYNKVIFSCALSDDISNWKNGDQTVIGERGINISGGQKARLALARAVYSRAEIYVLDDPLSAVDAHVKRHILDHVIMDSGLLAGKIRIMATHEEKLLPYFDTILQLDSKGNVTTLQQDACEYQPKLLDASTQLDAKTDNPESDNASLKSSLSEKPDDEEDCAAQGLPSSGKKKYSNWDNACYVLKICGLPTLTLIVILVVLAPLSKFILDGYKLAALKKDNSTGAESNQAMLNYLLINLISQIVLESIIRLEEYSRIIISGKLLNSKVKNIFLKNIIHAPVSFFDSTTRQELSNAYNNGARVISERIPFTLIEILTPLVNACFSLYRVGTNAPQLLALVPLFVWAKIKLDSTTILASSSVEAIEYKACINESKVEDVIADGQQMIRIFNVENHFTSKYIRERDTNQRILIPRSSFDDISTIMSRFLSEISHTVCKVALIAHSQIFGISISSAEFVMFARLTERLMYSASNIMDIPRKLLSYEGRTSTFRSYTDLECEKLCTDDAEIPEQSWPSLGKIEFSNFSMKYRQDLEYALKEINLTIKPGEKVGIVGRTGAGKTSLARCLFRLVGNSTCNGAILIDGHNIQSMNIRDVRAKLGIILQEPTLFNGTFRQNLDPLVKYTVEDMWSAIVKCGIVDLVQPKLGHGDDSTNDGIILDKDGDDELLKEIERWKQKWNGSGWMMRTFLYLFVRKPTLDDRRVPSIRPHGLNRYAKDTFSSGQKQLVGLCRLLMRNRKIIVLDEATANVDPESDQNMHRLIHSEFKNCTVLTIAHRLETIMNSDRIIVMDNGEVAEIGRPEELLEKKGYFAELVKANDFGE